MQKKILIKTSFCQERCQIAVLKAISKVHGVDEVAIDAKNNTVTLIGDIDVTKVVKNLAKVGKMSDILSIAPYKKEVPNTKPKEEAKPKAEAKPKEETKPKEEAKSKKEEGSKKPKEEEEEGKPKLKEAKNAESLNPKLNIEIIPHCNGYCGGSCSSCYHVGHGCGLPGYHREWQGQIRSPGNYCGGCHNDTIVYEEDNNCIIM